MNDVTVLYYSANTEDPKFETKIREKILASKGDLPLVSVTQEPAPDFGTNICVGKQYNCYGNEFRQIEIGLKEVKTKYVLTAEADFLYPPEYFQFQPDDADYYHYANVWIHFVRHEKNRNAWAQKKAYFKLYSDGAQMVKKDFWLDQISKGKNYEEKWYTKDDQPKSLHPRFVINENNIWKSKNPVLSFKTYFGVQRNTRIDNKIQPVENLEYWGDIEKLKKEMFL